MQLRVHWGVLEAETDVLDPETKPFEVCANRVSKEQSAREWVKPVGVGWGGRVGGWVGGAYVEMGGAEA